MIRGQKACAEHFKPDDPRGIITLNAQSQTALSVFFLCPLPLLFLTLQIYVLQVLYGWTVFLLKQSVFPWLGCFPFPAVLPETPVVQ